MNSAQNISVCMVVKDEADFLEKSLKSILPVVQEVVLVDTGSSDDTLQIARRFNLNVFTFPWRNDFSAARNFSLDLATMPWILVLDADEVLSPQDHPRLSLLLGSEKRAAYSLSQRNYLEGSGKLTWTESWKPNRSEYEEGREYSGYLDVPVVRLFPRRSDLRFLGCVHESVEESLARTDLQIKTSGLVLHHYGQVRAPERMRRKKQFYLELGLRKLEKNPSLRAQFELGIQYQELGCFEQAIPHFLEAVHHESTEFRIADLYLGICFSKIGKLADARFHLSRARDRHPGSAGLLCELGLVNAKEGKVPEAIAAFKQALAIDAEHVAALCYLGSLLVGEDQAVEGTGLLEKAVQIDSNHFDSWINLAAAYQKVGRPSITLNCLERACALKPENSDVARRLARAYAVASRYTDAAQILNQAVNRDPGDERLKMYWAALLSMSGQEDQGRNVYESILKAGGKFAGLAQRQLEKMNTRMTAVRLS